MSEQPGRAATDETTRTPPVPQGDSPAAVPQGYGPAASSVSVPDPADAHPRAVGEEDDDEPPAAADEGSPGGSATSRQIMNADRTSPAEG